jgi:hypothetical protein
MCYLLGVFEQRDHSQPDQTASLTCSARGAPAVCAILGTYKDEELRAMFDQLQEFEMSFFSSSTATEFFRHLLFKGTLHDHEVLTARLRKLFGDLTFLEAYVRTGVQPPGSPCAHVNAYSR